MQVNIKLTNNSCTRVLLKINSRFIIVKLKNGVLIEFSFWNFNLYILFEICSALKPLIYNCTSNIMNIILYENLFAA